MRIFFDLGGIFLLHPPIGNKREVTFHSAEESLAIQIEVDRSWSLSTPMLPNVGASDDDTDVEEPSNSRLSSRSKSRRVQSYHGLEHANHVSSSMRSHQGTLNSRHLRMSTLSSTPVPSPSIRSSSSHPDISSLCKQWESTGPANVTLTYKPGGTTISSSSSKSKGRKRSPTFT